MTAEADATPGQPPGPDFRHGRFALFLGVLIFAAFPHVILGLQTFVLRDFGLFAYPLAYYQRDCFWQGELPLWNPYNNCGVPFLAQWNTMPLYPPALVYLVLPLTWSLSFFCLIHLFSAGLGMYCLARRWTGTPFGAAIAGLVFAFNGFTLNMLMWPSHIATLSWMPWVVLTVEAAWNQGGRKMLVAVAIGALQMLAGGPETILFTWLILLVLWLIQLVTAGSPLATGDDPGTRFGCGRLAMLWRFPLVAVWIGAVSAPQLLPFLDLVIHSQRELGYADARWAMQGRAWANFLVPMAFGHVSSLGVFFQQAQLWTSSFYLGAVTMVLGVVAALTVRERRVWLLVALAAAGILLALGEDSFVFRGLRSMLPQLSMITYPVKFLTLVVFAVPVLAAFAVRELQEGRSERSGRFRYVLLAAMGVGVMAIAAIILWARNDPAPGEEVNLTLRNGLERIVLLTMATGVLFGLSRGAGLKSGRPRPAQEGGTRQADSRAGPAGRPTLGFRLAPTLPFLLVAVLWLDLWTHMPSQNPTAPPSVYRAGLARDRHQLTPQPALGASRVMLSPDAVRDLLHRAPGGPVTNYLAKRLAFFCDCNLLDEVPKVDGFFSLYPRECGELNSIMYSSTNAEFRGLADFMAVAHVTSPENATRWQPRNSFLPWITVGARPLFLDDTNALTMITRDEFDARRTVVLPAEFRSALSATEESTARVLWSKFGTRRAEAEVKAASPTLAVFSQTWYHRWQARVDGKPARLLRANYAFQAVEVPAGTHRIEIVYADAAFAAGLAVACVGLIALAAVWNRKAKA
jgi:hypothetical protein